MFYSSTYFPLLLLQYGMIIGVATASFVSNYAPYTTENHRMFSTPTTTKRSVEYTFPSFTKRYAHDAENDESITQESLLQPTPNNQKTATHDVALYIHIPYCRQRCRYCDFAIVPIGNSVMSFTSNDNNNDNQNQQEKGFLRMDQTYREAILKELSLIQKRYNNHHKLDKDQQSQPPKIRLRSIYFGGGTPSLAPLETIEAIMNMILGSKDSDNNGIFDVVGDDPSEIEITMEIDPGTFTLSKLQSLKNLGINRLSLGIQSFDDSILRSIGRVHRYQDIVDSLQMIQQAYGCNGDDRDDDETNSTTNINYSIDLISGLPGLTLAKWVETLQIATKLVPQPSHISLYDLQIESGTVFGQWYDGHDDDDEEDNDGGDFASIGQTRGASPLPATTSPRLPSASDCAFMYKFASGYLRSKGFEHYEISSYARLDSEKNQPKDTSEKPSSKRSKHNQIYWEPDSEWYAVGLGATSSIGGHRYARPRALSDYVNWVNLQQDVDNPDWLAVPASVIDSSIDADDIDDDDYLTDIVMTRLRTSDGLDLNWIKHNIADGSRKVEAILRGAELGLDLGLAELLNPSLDANSGADCSDSGILRLIDPNGFVFSNSIISSIFLELEELG